IASGIPKFFPLAMIQQEGNPYVRDDTMFIKVMIDFGDVLKPLLPYALSLNPGLPTNVQQLMIKQEIERRAQSATWLSVLVHTIAGDFSILKNFLYLEDSMACRLRVAMIFSLTSALFHSFLLHALWCFFKVIFHSIFNVKILCYFSLHRVYTYILLILISWFLSLVIVLPAWTKLNVFSYFPEQYHCLISFTNVRGFIYSLCSTYVIPVLVIIYIYSRLIIFIRHGYNFNHRSRTRREIMIVKRILIICAILSLSGSPTLVFLFQFIMTGRLHPLADRVHELGLAINTNIVTFGFAILNSLIKLLPKKFTHRKQPQTSYRQPKKVLSDIMP
ncbi:unnamed protein product, partial [Rotaria sp. Silwood2]